MIVRLKDEHLPVFPFFLPSEFQISDFDPMFARFFIDRPIFASVISVVIVILGLLAYIQLPMTLFPNVSPPTVYVRAQYPGASPETAVDSGTDPQNTDGSGRCYV